MPGITFMETNGKIKIDDGLYVKPHIWYYVKILREVANTLFSFSAGVGFHEAYTGQIPIFGATSLIIITVIKNVLNGMLEWKAKYDLPDNTLTTKSTVVKGDTIEQSESIQKIENIIEKPEKKS